MRITSDRQPFCRCCGTKLKRSTDLHLFGVPLGTTISPWEGRPHPEEPANRAEAQRFLNQRIVSSRKDHAGRLKVVTWDGESYRTELEFFCTLRCASTYGRFAVACRPDLRTQAYADAVDQAEALGSGGAE